MALRKRMRVSPMEQIKSGKWRHKKPVCLEEAKHTDSTNKCVLLLPAFDHFQISNGLPIAPRSVTVTRPLVLILARTLHRRLLTKLTTISRIRSIFQHIFNNKMSANRGHFPPTHRSLTRPHRISMRATRTLGQQRHFKHQQIHCDVLKSKAPLRIHAPITNTFSNSPCRSSSQWTAATMGTSNKSSV